ncbi:MAG: hypothetical protein PVH46_03365 [Granulosicoccaceae bacterium]|jgi:hypothetical protein
MADLFSMTAPLLLVFPGGEKRLMAEKFAHPEGLVFFDPYWLESGAPAVHVLKGELLGEGPWKIGDVVVRVLSCGDTEESMQWSMWQQHLAMTAGDYHDEEAIRDIARQHGAMV